MVGLVCILFFGFLASAGCIFLICHRLKKIEECLDSASYAVVGDINAE